jgi:hypothetical protein
MDGVVDLGPGGVFPPVSESFHDFFVVTKVRFPRGS